MKGPHFRPGGIAEAYAEIQDVIVQLGRLVVFMQGIDGGDDDRALRQLCRFYEPQRRGARPYQVPVRVRQQRT